MIWDFDLLKSWQDDNDKVRESKEFNRKKDLFTVAYPGLIKNAILLFTTRLLLADYYHGKINIEMYSKRI